MVALIRWVWVVRCINYDIALPQYEGWPDDLNSIKDAYYSQLWLNSINVALCFFTLAKYAPLSSHVGVFVRAVDASQDFLGGVILLFVIWVLAYGLSPSAHCAEEGFALPGGRGCGGRGWVVNCRIRHHIQWAYRGGGGAGVVRGQIREEILVFQFAVERFPTNFFCAIWGYVLLLVPPQRRGWPGIGALLSAVGLSVTSAHPAGWGVRRCSASRMCAGLGRVPKRPHCLTVGVVEVSRIGSRTKTGGMPKFSPSQNAEIIPRRTPPQSAHF